MSLFKAMKDLKFDKRLTEWNLANGQITKEEWKKHLEALPDMKDKVEFIDLEEGSSSANEPH